LFALQFLGKNKVPKAVRTKIEKMSELSVSDVKKEKRKPPKERKPYTPKAKGLRGRTK
jgi:hypothetical protein